MGRMIQVPFGHTMVSRIEPMRGPEHYKTYSMRAPFSTHWRRATCEEYGCHDFLSGFVTTVDVSTDLGAKQFHYLKNDRDRSPSMQRVGQTLFKFVYGPGNPCMRRAEHRAPLNRPPIYLVAEGDWRGNPRKLPPLIHRTPEDWVDDFATHQNQIVETIKRG